MRRYPTFGRRLAIAALALAIGGGMAACGDDDDEEEAGGTTTTVAQSVQVRNYCEKSLEIETYPEPEFDDDATPEEQMEAAKEFAREILPLGEETVAAAPEELNEDGNLRLDTIRQIAETGDFSAFEENPEVGAAEERLHAYDLENCGWGQADVTAVEYEFQGVPATLRPGPTSFDLVNTGEEPHELVLFKINEDVTEPATEIFALEQEEAEKKVTDEGGTFAPPGETAYKVVELEAGRYAMACFVPVGGGDEGPPHTSRGMVAEFKVA